MYWQIQKIFLCLAYVLWGGSHFIRNQILWLESMEGGSLVAATFGARG